METKFTEQESLAVISEMIKQARNNFQKGSGTNFIFNGILVSITAILNVVLAFIFIKSGINANYSFWVWCLMIPGTFVNRLIDKKVERTAMVKTHIGSIISSIWNGFGISICVFLATIFTIGFGKEFYAVFYLINPVILTLIGLAEFSTAKSCRFKPFLYGAIIMWVGAVVSAVVVAMWIWEPVFIQFFILAICMIFGFVMPGYQLNELAKKDV